MSFGENKKARIAELEGRIEHLETVNGALCMEINRQERVIESQAERIRELELTPRKLYAVDTWDDLDDIGEHYVEPNLYRTREAAMRRAAQIEKDDDLGVRRYASVYEFEAVDE